MSRPTLPTNWGTKEKVLSRSGTIVAAWKELTGLDSLPPKTQYWSLCGNLTDGCTGVLDANCELNQLLHERLIQSQQFNGVEWHQDVHAANVSAIRKAFPDERTRPHLYEGDFAWSFDAACVSSKFRPALVNLDTHYNPERGFDLLARTLAILNYCKLTAMVSWNTVIERWYLGSRQDFYSHLDKFHDHRFLHRTWQLGGWEHVQTYSYKGTSRSSVTKMLTLTFWNGVKSGRSVI